ncbi:uncharacterized protein LOC113502087 [Trichoplusia ni]|uniref:Uncharacterized protein LOC113502087 n=1 Tax=Trichoplusia ni TaxID=7111 RepID=A0A7E5WFS6_TRINI|nr:uncharacterized protein LOC113502087 [Trichoplusia ni]
MSTSLQKLLNNIATNNAFNNCTIDINELSSGGANYSSKLYTVDIIDVNKLKEDLHLFVKVSVLGENIRKNYPPSFFDTEMYCYTDLLEAFKELENECGLTVEDGIAFAKFYGGDPTRYQETVVLENLVAHGYHDFDRFHSFDWAYALSAVTELAKFHALSYAYREKRPAEFEKALDRFKKSWKPGVNAEMENSAKDSALKCVKPEYRDVLETFLDKYMNNILCECYATAARPVLVHGDYRGSNLLHRYTEASTLSSLRRKRRI